MFKSLAERFVPGLSENRLIQEQRSNHEYVRDNFFNVGGLRLAKRIKEHIETLSGGARMEISVSYCIIDPENTKLGMSNAAQTVDESALREFINKASKSAHELLSSIEIKIDLIKDKTSSEDKTPLSIIIKISREGVTVNNKSVKNEQEAMTEIIRALEPPEQT